MDEKTVGLERYISHLLTVKMAEEVLESVYSLLVKRGHSGAAKQLLKEAKLDESKAKKANPDSLIEAFASHKCVQFVQFLTAFIKI